MTLYLTDRTDPAEVARAKASGHVHGFKLYPAGATTHSDAGVTDIEHIYGVLERMSEHGMVLQVHGEVTDESSTCSIAKRASSTRCSSRWRSAFPKLRIVFEHITTRHAVDFVRSAREGVAATITPQHLLMNRNALFAGGIRPHQYCLPVLKTEPDRVALVEAATSGDSALLPRHRQRPARAAHQGKCLRLRGHLLRARGHRAVCRGLRSRRRARQAARALPPSSARISMACRATTSASSS